MYITYMLIKIDMTMICMRVKEENVAKYRRYIVDISHIGGE